MTSRRKFLQNSATIIGGSALVSATSNNAFAIFKNSISPKDQLNIGAIGINGMGWRPHFSIKNSGSKCCRYCGCG